MVKIRENLLDPGKYDLKCPVEATAAGMKYIVVHNTGNCASAANEVAYMIGNDSPTAFNAAVDDQEIVIGIPFDKGAFAAGTRDSAAHGIHIEICYSLKDGDLEKFKKAERNAAEYIAQLLKERGWDIAHVKKHQDFDGKYCPHRTLALGWERFLNMVEGFLDGTENTYVTGKTYRTQVDALAVRTGAGTGYARKAYRHLTVNARQHAYANGRLKKGTAVTCLETRRVGEEIWMRIPSGWCAAYYKGSAYIQ